MLKVTNADGTCSLIPVNPAPQILLAPDTVVPSPAQGGSTAFTATLKNVTNPAGIPITLLVTGANSGMYSANADASGNASFTYNGVAAGADHVLAFANPLGSLLQSNLGSVTWTKGKHSTSVSLNQSPASGGVNTPSESDRYAGGYFHVTCRRRGQRHTELRPGRAEVRGLHQQRRYGIVLDHTRCESGQL